MGVFGGADGIVARSLKKTEEKPLNSRVYCHLLIFPMSLRNPWRSFGHPYNALFWQQLATVSSGAVWVAQRSRRFPDPVFLVDSFRVGDDSDVMARWLESKCRVRPLLQIARYIAM